MLDWLRVYLFETSILSSCYSNHSCILSIYGIPVPHRDDLREEVEEYMKEFDENQQQLLAEKDRKSREPDADGFVTVKLRCVTGYCTMLLISHCAHTVLTHPSVFAFRALISPCTLSLLLQKQAEEG